jgi:RNA polymerase sigma-70 factor (ECF subfamily)
MITHGNSIKIFAGPASKVLAREIADILKMELGEIEIGKFSDGETMVNIKESVRGRDVFVIQSTSAPVNDSIMELLIMIDALRRRRRRAYAGAWLPSPVEAPDGEGLDLRPSDAPDPEARYGLAESATYAFLVALEALGPRQRAVLLLRDVLGHSAREAAELLGGSEGGVRVLHLRARRALEAYDERRCVPTPALRERHRAALQGFLDCLLADDPRGLEALLAESVVTVTDAAGEFTALATPLAGRERVARLYLVAARNRRETGTRTEIRLVNGLPAALIALERPVRRQAPRTLLRCELDAEGRIVLVQAILAPRKLAALAGA